MENTESTVLRGKKVSLLSLGCKVNAYETECFKEKFRSAGARIIDFEEGNADIVVINTCSVTNIADRKSRQMLHRARKLSPNAVIVATGCYVQAAGEKMVEGTDADIAADNDRKSMIVALAVRALEQKESSSIGIPGEGLRYNDNSTSYDSDSVLQPCHERTRAFIKVQDGCNQFCTYCIIPYVRGRVRSRSIRDVVEEVKRFAGCGYREVVLTGIHLSSFGVDKYDSSVKKGFAGEPLLELIDEVSKVERIERIRLGSLEPRIITGAFVDRIRNNPKICPHFHLSLQSGSNRVLKAMNRHYTTQEYENACTALRNAYEAPSINTDIIVGFPGETEEEFEETLEFAQKTGFAKIHVFKYSRRKGTLADKMPGQIPEDVKNARSARLIEVDNANHRKYIEGFIGKKVRVLIEKKEFADKTVYMTGLTERYAEVGIANEKLVPNTFAECEITGISDKGFLVGVEK